jgi:hypothetical protein
LLRPSSALAGTLEELETATLLEDLDFFDFFEEELAGAFAFAEELAGATTAELAGATGVCTAGVAGTFASSSNSANKSRTWPKET